MSKKKKLKMPRSYAWWGVGGTVVQYGIPLSYIVWQYDIFQFEEGGRSITGWGIVFAAILVSLFKNKVQEFVIDYNKHLNTTAQRGKWGFSFLFVALFLGLAQYWLQNTLIFFLVLGGSNLLSLALYSPYDKKKTEYIEMKDLLLEKQREEKIKGMSL
jgi:hypothetical protein